MPFFGSKLSEVERHLFGNVKKTKSVFPEVTLTMEYGLGLMFDLSEDVNEAVSKSVEPNLFANRSLFARNRQLLLVAYFCFRCSNYGTQFVILRTVLENNNLMRLFNLHPQYAYEWLSSEKHKRFPLPIQAKYGKSGKHDRAFKNWRVRDELFKEIKEEKVAEGIERLYSELCEYTHPNFKGWHELMGLLGTEEQLLRMPAFSEGNAYEIIGLSLWSLQVSFKTLVETFGKFVSDFSVHLGEWQEAYKKLMERY
jgi:hypothetical protein